MKTTRVKEGVYDIVVGDEKYWVTLQEGRWFVTRRREYGNVAMLTDIGSRNTKREALELIEEVATA